MPERYIVVLLTVIIAPVFADSLDEGFMNPPLQAKTQVWWHWMHGNISREGITRDLEQMHKLGIGGATLFHNAWTKGNGMRPATPRGPIRFMSPEYRELVQYAIKECARLDMTMGLQICDGFSQTGGPWVTPETGMKALQCTKMSAKGGETLNCEVPDNTVFILAYPGRAKGSKNPMITPKNPYISKDDGRAVSRGDFINLTAQLQKDGRLTWNPPKGEWVVLVFHHTLHGATNHPASREGHGLECNKLNSGAVDVVYDAYVAQLINDAGPLAGKTLQHVLIDSWECGYQSWTEGFAEEFKKRRGYDPTPYLPVLARIPVESEELSNRFLCDFRVTLDDLILEQYYGHVRDRLHEEGMELHAEVLYGWAQMFGSPIRQYGVVDVPMNEIWMAKMFAARKQNIHGRAFTGYAAAAGHVYGREIIKDEAFTVGGGKGDFHYVPSLMKSSADFVLCRGTNRFVLHTSTHQPDEMKPGWTHGWNGVNFHRGNTWWPYAGGFVNYLGRCSYMLQQGLFVADVCRYVGQEDTYSEGYGELPIEGLPQGYRADHCDNTVLLERMDVKDGRVVLPDGMSYAVLMLADKKTMAHEVLRKLSELIEKGATVIGPKPETAPGLTNYPQCDDMVKEFADKLWGDCDGRTVTESKFGKGRVIWGKPLAVLLDEMNLKPDFSYKAIGGNGMINFIHRKLPDADIFFLATAGEACIADCAFRITGKQPELFDPMTGEVTDIAVYQDLDGQTRIPLRLEAQGARIIVFRKKASDSVVEIKHNGSVVFAPGKPLSGLFRELPAQFSFRENGALAVHQQNSCGALEWIMVSGKKGFLPQASLPKTIPVSGPWTVAFEPGRGTPESIELQQLESLSEHADFGVQHFSGVATYRQTLTLPKDYFQPGHRVELNLGDVKDLAEVYINGEPAGILWRAPFKLDITSHVRPGRNKLEIKTINTWVNRLIGDKKVPEEEWVCKIVSPNPKWYTDKSKLLPSGLLGPVSIQFSSVKIGLPVNQQDGGKGSIAVIKKITVLFR